MTDFYECKCGHGREDHIWPTYPALGKCNYWLAGKGCESKCQKFEGVEK
jgi:hypothetical protein